MPIPFNPCSKWLATNADMENGCLAMDVLDLSCLRRTVSTSKCLVSSVTPPMSYNLLCSKRFDKRGSALQHSNKRHSVGAVPVISLLGIDKGDQGVLVGHRNHLDGAAAKGEGVFPFGSRVQNPFNPPSKSGDDRQSRDAWKNS